MTERKHVSSACHSCRKRRAKCNGRTPCANCSHRNIDCVYDAFNDGRLREVRLQRIQNEVMNRLNQRSQTSMKRHSSGPEQHGSTSDKLLRLLRDCSDHDSHAILKDIRSGVDPKIIMQRAGHEDLLAELDFQDHVTAHEEIVEFLTHLPTEDAQRVVQSLRAQVDIYSIISQVKAGNLLLQMAAQPDTRLRYEFPYRTEMPEDCVANNPYLNSLIYEASFCSNGNWSNRNHDSQATTSKTSSYRDLYLKPFHAAEVVDPLLYDARISSWTQVCGDDMLMRKLLGVWLRCEYQFTTAFQKDLFLEDMAAQREDFCSSLLVNVVLAYACICYPGFPDRAEYWNPHTLTYRFIAEARRLWELEAHKPCVTTIQAGMLFSVFYNLCGLDEVGQPYRIQAVRLALDMHLFESTTTPRNRRMYNGRAFTAWALFNWETLVGFSFMFTPLLSNPPNHQLPDPLKEQKWYGEIWVKYPMSDRPLPSNFGQVFRAKSRFRVIMNRACQVMYKKGLEITPDQASDLLLQLRHWYDDLPEILLPKAIVLPGHLQLHMYYHHLVLTIFEPLLNLQIDGTASPQKVVADARKYLQTLVRIYYLRHGYEAMDLFIVIPLVLIAFDCTDLLNDQMDTSDIDSVRSTLILVTKGLHNQRRNHYLAEALFRVVRGRMRASEVKLFRGIMEITEDQVDQEQIMAQSVRSHWPVRVIKRKEDMDSHILTNLVQNYAHLSMVE